MLPIQPHFFFYASSWLMVLFRNFSTVVAPHSAVVGNDSHDLFVDVLHTV